MRTRRTLSFVVFLLTTFLIPLIAAAAISPPDGIVAPPDPLRFQIEYCWNGEPCGLTVATLYADGTFLMSAGETGLWLFNSDARTGAQLYNTGCQPIYVGYMAPAEMSGPMLIGEMYCQNTDVSCAFGTWTGTYLPPGVAGIVEHGSLVPVDGVGRSVATAPALPDSFSLNLGLEFCWGGGYPCGNVTGLHLTYPDGTLWTDEAATGIWLYNPFAGTSAMLMSGGCHEAYIGRSVNGIESLGTMHCLDGSWMWGEWGTYLWEAHE